MYFIASLFFCIIAILIENLTYFSASIYMMMSGSIIHLRTLYDSQDKLVDITNIFNDLLSINSRLSDNLNLFTNIKAEVEYLIKKSYLSLDDLVKLRNIVGSYQE
jgi:hypothetical protein